MPRSSSRHRLWLLSRGTQWFREFAPALGLEPRTRRLTVADADSPSSRPSASWATRAAARTPEATALCAAFASAAIRHPAGYRSGQDPGQHLGHWTGFSGRSIRLAGANRAYFLLVPKVGLEPTRYF